MTYPARRAFGILQKTPTNEIIQPIDFSDDLGEGETIATFDSVAVVEGDAGGTPHLVVAKNGISEDGTLVQVTITEGVAGNSYRVIARVTTTNSQKLSISGPVYVGSE